MLVRAVIFVAFTELAEVPRRTGYFSTMRREASYTYAQISLDCRLGLIGSIAGRLGTRVRLFEACRLTLGVACPSG